MRVFLTIPRKFELVLKVCQKIRVYNLDEIEKILCIKKYKIEITFFWPD